MSRGLVTTGPKLLQPDEKVQTAGPCNQAMISDYIKKLSGDNAKKRARLAEEIGDFVEYGRVSTSDAEKLAAALIQQIAEEKDQEAREALLNTLVILGSNHLGLKVPWERLVPLLDTLDSQCLEHALFALG